MKQREMHINVLAALIVAAISAAPTQTAQAQYVIPNVNTGTKSNDPAHFATTLDHHSGS